MLYFKFMEHKETHESEQILPKKQLTGRERSNQNLKINRRPFTKEEAREMGKKGAEVSAQRRREKKLMSQAYAKVLTQKYNVNFEGETKRITGQRMIIEKIIPDILKKSDSASVRMMEEMRAATEGNLLKIDGELKTPPAVNYDPVYDICMSVLIFFSHAGKPAPLYTDAIFIVIEGGRSGGKTIQVIDIVLFLVCIREGPGIAVMFRNTKDDALSNIYPLIIERMATYGISDYFDITKKNITCRKNGVTIRFMGTDDLKRKGSGKGIPGLFLLFSDEAQYLKQDAIEIIIPTFLRTREDEDKKENKLENTEYLSKAFFSYNLEYENDPVHVEFAKNESRKNTVLHIHMDYTENYLCPKSIIQEAERMKATDYEGYLHVYKGEPIKKFKGSLWPKNLIDSITSGINYRRDNYIKVVIACDPAETNTEFSNEYGIQVEGKTFSGKGHHIKDLSGKMSPTEFAKKVIGAYYDYQANSVVVETNAGGDFIKSLILTIDPNIIIEEVKAKPGQSKVFRAIPVANICEQGMIEHINNGDQLLHKQLTRMTKNGFVGPSGESPDRVDAYCWGFISLFDLWDMKTQSLIFKQSMFNNAPDDYSIIYQNYFYVGFTKNMYGVLCFDIINKLDENKFVLTDYHKGKKINIITDLIEILNKTKAEIYIPDDTTGSRVNSELRKKFVGINTIESDYYISKPINERVTQILPFVSSGKICLSKDLINKTYENETGNLFINEILGYSDDDKTERPLLDALCNMIFYEGQIE